jgi:hypothetical protein
MVSYTSRQDALAQRATNSVVLRVACGRDAAIEVQVIGPAQRTLRKTLGELAAENEIEFTGLFQSASVLLHRLVTPDRYRDGFRSRDKGRRGAADWYMARAVQTNGHLAWSSPIWAEGWAMGPSRRNFLGAAAWSSPAQRPSTSPPSSRCAAPESPAMDAWCAASVR